MNLVSRIRSSMITNKKYTEISFIFTLKNFRIKLFQEVLTKCNS